ncbi:unnamed protein product [Caenorhabditis brenneri]
MKPAVILLFLSVLGSFAIPYQAQGKLRLPFNASYSTIFEHQKIWNSDFTIKSTTTGREIIITMKKAGNKIHSLRDADPDENSTSNGTQLHADREVAFQMRKRHMLLIVPDVLGAPNNQYWEQPNTMDRKNDCLLDVRRLCGSHNAHLSLYDPSIIYDVLTTVTTRDRTDCTSCQKLPALFFSKLINPKETLPTSSLKSVMHVAAHTTVPAVTCIVQGIQENLLITRLCLKYL